jgi:hypothetical protein
MAATEYNFNIEQGTIFAIDFRYLDSRSNPRDLSNHCIIMRIQPLDGLNSDLITLTTTGNTTTPNYSFRLIPPEGRIQLRLPAETTNSYSWTTANYELEIISPDLFYNGGSRIVKRLIQGTITLRTRLIPSANIPSCTVSEEIIDQSFTGDLDLSSYSITDSCIGSPCEFIGGNAVIYNMFDPLTELPTIYLQDRVLANNENIYGKSNPFPLSVSVTESRIIERIDVYFDGFSHSSPTDVRLLLTHNGSGVLLLDQNKFPGDNKPKNLSFILSDYAIPRPNGSDPTLANIRNYIDPLVANKNLAVALPGCVNPASLSYLLPIQAFNSSDSNRNIPIYSSGLKTFEGMDVFGDWKLYGIDYNERDSGLIGSVKLIVYFQNESSNSELNFNSCGDIHRNIVLSGTAVTIDGDLTYLLNNGDIVIIEYDNGSGIVATTRTISSDPQYSTVTAQTTFVLDSAILGTVDAPKLLKYNVVSGDE